MNEIYAKNRVSYQFRVAIYSQHGLNLALYAFYGFKVSTGLLTMDIK